MASPGAAVLGSSPAVRRGSPGVKQHISDRGNSQANGRSNERRFDGNAFDLLSRAGPAITMSSLHSTPQVTCRLRNAWKGELCQHAQQRVVRCIMLAGQQPELQWTKHSADVPSCLRRLWVSLWPRRLASKHCRITC